MVLNSHVRQKNTNEDEVVSGAQGTCVLSGDGSLVPRERVPARRGRGFRLDGGWVAQTEVQTHGILIATRTHSHTCSRESSETRVLVSVEAVLLCSGVAGGVPSTTATMTTAR